MEIKIKYANLAERQQEIKVQEANNLRMPHDDFDPDWKAGDEPHGVMTFTDEPSPVVLVKPSEIDLVKSELDVLKTEIEKLKAKLGMK